MPRQPHQTGPEEEQGRWCGNRCNIRGIAGRQRCVARTSGAYENMSSRAAPPAVWQQDRQRVEPRATRVGEGKLDVGGTVMEPIEIVDSQIERSPAVHLLPRSSI